MSTFVAVGNATQPFRRLLDAVAGLAGDLPQPITIQYGAALGFAAANCRCVDFVGMDEFATLVAAADLLILHAGAGSVIHAVRAGKVPVVVPRRVALGEHVDDHQLEFARELARLDRIVVCEDVSLLLSAVNAAQRLQRAAATRTDEPVLVGELRRLLQQHAADVGKGDSRRESTGERN